MVGFPLLLGWRVPYPSACVYQAFDWARYMFTLACVHPLMRSPPCPYSISSLILVKLSELARYLPAS